MGVTFGGNIEEKLEGACLHMHVRVACRGSLSLAHTKLGGGLWWGSASFNLFDEDGNGELSEAEIERMLLMATRAVVRKRYNTHEDTKKATGNTAVTIPEELKGRIKEIVRGIFEKIDEDQVRALLLLPFSPTSSLIPPACRAAPFRWPSSRPALVVIRTSAPSSSNSRSNLSLTISLIFLLSIVTHSILVANHQLHPPEQRGCVEVCVLMHL
jgi:hypothetical protein